MAKKVISTFLLGLFMVGDSSAMNEISPSQPNSSHPSAIQENMDNRNIHICPDKIDYETLKSGYAKKKMTSFGAEFTLPNLTVQISENSIKVLNNALVKYESQIKTNSNSHIEFIRGEPQRGRCTYSIYVFDSQKKANKPESLGAFGVSMISLSEKEKQFQKYLLMKEALGNKDVAGVIAKNLDIVSQNPVLDATLEYTDPQTTKKSSIKIGTKIKNGLIDLSDKAFYNLDDHLDITTDPSTFFAINNKDRIVMLIVPWSVINDKLADTAASFQPIMSKWDKTVAPIGIFWRRGSDRDKSKYLYQVKLSMNQISASTLYDMVSSAAQNNTDSIHFYAALQKYWPNAALKFDNKK